ncbi:hypothetical protein [Pedococcus sp.]|jgi:hypothetical protein|uniref:hypothetical protein n=1 Tax=Pedococcus sp. TaxID=2860345 RepID=UPI002E1505C0|nr:hypothetical protein [Pedococcus sp.]
MSDLHCPATVLLVGPDQDARAVSRFRNRRVAAVYADSAPASVSTARRIADVLGVGTPPLQAATATPEALRALGDQHRGETVLVVSADPAACGYRLPVELEVDELGLRLVPSS